MTCSVEKIIVALVETSISSLLLLKMLCELIYKVIKKPVNSDIIVSLNMTNLLSSTQKIDPLGKMLKQSLILLKK
ncbi:hypothetical protein F383_23256 [Gossypium arboreum]|uniref:Uncharacterized protein n=1 Tax=Gossypium arboreum TaxID=29729 RepID=A0A0B0P0U4_GOSAR|nr:hypothetical protein F383_23256 [Gossypium arboreum]